VDAQSVYANSELVEKVDDHRRARGQHKPKDERRVDDFYELRGSARNRVRARQMARRDQRKRELSSHDGWTIPEMSELL